MHARQCSIPLPASDRRSHCRDDHCVLHIETPSRSEYPLILLPVATSSPHRLSITERLTGLEHIGDSLLRFFVPQKLQKCLALEIEDILLGDHAGLSVAARQHVRDLLPDPHVVIADLSRLAHRPYRVMQVA